MHFLRLIKNLSNLVVCCSTHEFNSLHFTTFPKVPSPSVATILSGTREMGHLHFLHRNLFRLLLVRTSQLLVVYDVSQFVCQVTVLVVGYRRQRRLKNGKKRRMRERQSESKKGRRRITMKARKAAHDRGYSSRI